MRILKKTVSILLALVMVIGVFTIVPFTVSAEDAAAYYRNNSGDIEYFTNAWDAWNKAEQNSGTFGLLRDWVYNRRRNIRGTQVMTVELNGHVMSRGRGKTSWENDGDVIYVGEGGTLNVYGGTKADPSLGSDTVHTLYGYTHGNETFDYTKLTFKGGVIHGGNSSNGAGGIQMKKKSTVNLYYATIAGCRAEQTGGSDGYGGGIYMGGTNCKLYMDHSAISYNYAYNDGGGVYVNNERCSIKMVKSHIDHNISDDNGGGIYADDEYFRLEGDAEQIMDPESITDWNDESLGSSVSYNYIVDSDAKWGGGGGLYLDNDHCIVSGVNFIGNDADDDGDGGGIYSGETEILIENCNFVSNRADMLGGGIKVDNEKNTINNCTIYGNIARDTGGAGGGVYLNNDDDLNIKGSTIIRNNSSKSYTNNNDNLYLAGAGGDPTCAFINPELSPGADIHVRKSRNHRGKISVKGTFNDKYFTCDEDGKYVRWNNVDRYLEIIEGSKPVEVVDTFVPDSGKRTQSVSGGYTVNNTNYELLKGVFEYPAFDDTTADLEGIFYYSDGYFMGDPNKYNEHLATMSFCLAGASGYSNIGGTATEDNYLDKSNNFRQLMSDIGCKDEDIYVNDYNVVKPTSGSIGVGLATKTLENSETLVVIGIRGMGYESEWVSNMTLGASGEAQGWSTAAGQVMAELKSFLEREKINPESVSTKFWIAGYSRAGATANLTAKRIVDNYDKNGTHTFAYPLEAPKGGVESAKISGNNYNCIHNIINQNDIVPWVAPGQMGFIRYGNDHYIPGSVTDNFSNTAWNVTEPSDTTSDYGKQRAKMKEQLKAVNSGIVFDDYFHKGDLDYFDKVFGLDLVDETILDDWTTEEFISDFFEFFVKYGFGTESQRQGFATTEIANGKTFQEAAATAANLLMGKNADEAAGIAGCFTSLIDRLGTGDMIELYEAIRRDNIGVGSLIAPPMTIEMIVHMANGDKYWDSAKKTIWKYLTVLSEDDVAKGYHKLSEYMTDAELKEFESCFDALLDPIFEVLVADYANEDQKYIGTLAYNITRVIANHYPETTNAWLRSYDSFYANDTHAVTMDPSLKTAPSSVAVKITSADFSERVITDVSHIIQIKQGETISLIPLNDSDRDAGEAIYYHFSSGGDYAGTVHAFSAPLDLNKMYDDYATDNVFTIQATPAHNDQRGEEQILRFTLSGNAVYQVPESCNGDMQYTFSDTIMTPNQEYDIQSVEPNTTSDFSFTGWKVYPVTDGQAGTTPVEAKDYITYFGDGFDPNSENTTVKNLTGKSFRFTPTYNIYLDNLEINGSELLTSVDDPFGSGSIPVAWKEKTPSGSVRGELTVTKQENYLLNDDTDIIFTHLPSFVSEVEVMECFQTAHAFLITIEVSLNDFESDSDDWFEVQAKDINTGDLLDTLYFYEKMAGLTPKITLTAPVYSDMEFAKWGDNVHPVSGEITDPTITINRSSVSRTAVAEYRPIVKTVGVTLDNPLVIGEKMPALSSLTATVENTWCIDNAQLEWITSDVTAKHDTVYLAHISIDKATMTGTNLSVEGSESVDLSGKVAFADDIQAVIKDEAGSNLNVVASYFNQDDSSLYLDVVFARTGKAKVVGYDPISVFVPHGSTQADILSALPESVSVNLYDGTVVSVPAEWSSVSEIDTETLFAQTVTATGALDSDQYDTTGVNLTARVTISAVEKTPSPLASPGTGKYTGGQKIELTAADGATIYYAIIKTEKTKTVEDLDHKYPKLSDLDYTEYTEPIILNDYSKNNCLFAYATMDGLPDSEIACFVYDLTKPDTTYLEAKPAKIAEDGNIACWYVTREKKEYDPDSGDESSSTVIPYQYYADEDCLIPLDYKNDVVIPAFVKATYDATHDSDENLQYMGLGISGITYAGLDTFGVQETTGMTEVRVLTAVDSRIIRDASDFGYLFALDSGEDDDALTVENAPFKYSCKETRNGMRGGYAYISNGAIMNTDYKYVTARVQFGNNDRSPIRARFYVKLENGVDYIYDAETDCVETLDASTVMSSIEDNITFDATKDSLFTRHSISLGGNIGVNFYLNVPDEMVSDGKVKVDFAWTVEGNRKTHSVTLTADDKRTCGYKASCPVAAAEMTYDVTATVTIDGVVQDETNTYSVKKYADIILSEEYANEYDGEKPYEDLKALVQAMLDYGARSQLRFDRNTGKLANGGVYTFTDAVSPRDITPTQSGMNFEMDTYGLEYTGSTVVLLSETSIRHYYKIINQSRFNNYKDNITFDGNKVGYTVKDNEIYFELKGISASNLDTAYKINFGGTNYQYAVMDYVRNYLDKNESESNALTRDLVMAMYYYNQKANAYFD